MWISDILLNSSRETPLKIAFNALLLKFIALNWLLDHLAEAVVGLDQLASKDSHTHYKKNGSIVAFSINTTIGYIVAFS